MTRSSNRTLNPFIPELGAFERENRRRRRQQHTSSSEQTLDQDHFLDQGAVDLEAESHPSLVMENERAATLRELNQGVESLSQTCLNLPPDDHDWAIKPHIINILRKFHGPFNENPYNHLKTFAQECEAFKPRKLPWREQN